ncbi:MAG: YecR family lipoprotein [Vibrio splendidus]
MKKIILVILATSVLGGCAARNVNASLSSITGSKADGTVEMGYIATESPYQQTKYIVDWGMAEKIATKKCATWGYSKAESFGDFKTEKCQNSHYDAFLGRDYCDEKMISKTYQCIN